MMRDRAGRAVAAGLALAVLLVFGRTAGHQFLNFDDKTYVTHNPHVVSGLSWSGIAWAFTSTEASNWHPLTWLSHQLDATLYGLRPQGHHLTGVLLHAANAVLLFLLLRALTGALWRSALAAALFAVHPLRVESVAWVAERKDLLAGLFWILCCGAYLGWVRRGGAWRYALLSGCFVAGLLSKPMLVTLPAVLLLLDWWPLGRWGCRDRGGKAAGGPLRRPILEKLPLLLLSGISAALTLVAQRRGGALYLLEDLPLATRWANASLSYARYLGKTVWPADLALFYPLDPAAVPFAVAAFCAAALLAVTVAALRLAHPAPWFATGWCWYLGSLVPVIGLVQVGNQAFADRYTYIPLIGPALALAWGTGALASRFPAARRPAAAVWSATLGLLALAAFLQAGHWRDSETLMRQALAATEGNFVAHNNLGTALLAKGKTDEALPHFAEASRLRPSWGKPRVNLGEALLRRGDPEGALREFRNALFLIPAEPAVHDFLGQSLMALGRPREAASNFADALRLKPGFETARRHLREAEAAAGR